MTLSPTGDYARQQNPVDLAIIRVGKLHGILDGKACVERTRALVMVMVRAYMHEAYMPLNVYHTGHETPRLQLAHPGRRISHPVLQRRFAVRLRADAEADVGRPGGQPLHAVAGGDHVHAGLGGGDALRRAAGGPLEPSGNHRRRRGHRGGGPGADGAGAAFVAGVPGLRRGLCLGQLRARPSPPWW